MPLLLTTPGTSPAIVPELLAFTDQDDVPLYARHPDRATNLVFSTKDFKAVAAKYRTLIPEYTKGYVSLNQVAAWP